MSETVIVNVDEESVLARWADWQARGRRRPLAALATEGERPLLFVSNEVLVDPKDTGLVDELAGRHGAEPLPLEPLPPPPPGLTLRDDVDIDAMPVPLRLRFAQAPQTNGAGELGDLLGRELAGGRASITSDAAAHVATLVARLAAEGRPIGLNVVGDGDQTMPLSSAAEAPAQAGGANPFTWAAYSGRTRIVEAWQLIESVRAVRSLGTVFVAILDGGFWLDAAGAPLIAAGQAASDFGLGVMQINLQDESQFAGGPNPFRCGGAACPWHGNAVASIATAAVGNGAGAAGSGGTVATPVFFKTDLSTAQVVRCLQMCTAWGIDVLNMSFSVRQSDLVFLAGVWDNAFQFAADHGVVLVAAAGNDGKELPEHNIRPATRTPGVITVGALDTSDSAWSGSNYGSSVNVWAPGTQIPAAPDANSPNGSLWTGTSMAAPIVAGVAAMMRAVDDDLSTTQIRDLLAQTGWVGSGHVTRGLDAFAAVRAALHGTLPPDVAEPNQSAATATALLPTGPGGSLIPPLNGFATKTAADVDWFTFTIDTFSQVTATLDWYHRLSTLSLELEEDDPDARNDMGRTSSPGRVTLAGLLPPGTYRLRVTGTTDTAYRLAVWTKASHLPQDLFEPNDSFEAATRVRFETPKSPFLDGFLPDWGPGTFEATLHGFESLVTGELVVDDDYYRFDTPDPGALLVTPTIAVGQTDAPLDLTLYDSQQNAIREWTGVRSAVVEPPRASRGYLRVSGGQETRYSIGISLRMNKGVPTVWQEVDLLPHWWGDPPPFRLRDVEKYFAVDIEGNPGAGHAISFENPAEPVEIQLVDLEGAVLRRAAPENGRLTVSTRGLEPGTYALRVARASQDAAAGPLSLQLAPPL